MSGAGWSLKSGEIRKNSEVAILKIFEESLEKKGTTSYKLFLLKVIFKNIKQNKNELAFEEVYRDMLTEFYKMYYKYKNEMNLKNKKSLLYILLEEKNIKSKDELYKIDTKDLKFLSNYMFGALYSDTKGIFFGFSKQEKKISLNLDIRNEINEEIMFRLKDRTIIDLGLDPLNILEDEIREAKELEREVF
ncbi:MAG: hypothetical protein ACRC0F_02965 [Cetobacterium sp.]